MRWDSGYGQNEHQANVFAANLLMPLDDYRRQISASAKVDLDMIGQCAERYRVSLIAAALRWLSFTEKRAVLVVSRDGFILWARSSEPALKTGAFFRTSKGPIETPSTSSASQPGLLVEGKGAIDHVRNVWFPEPVRELALFAEHYDFTVSLLLLDDHAPFLAPNSEEPDTYDKFVPAERRREW